MEGPLAALGKATTSGAKLYLDHINKQGGVYGRQIKLLTHDDGYDPTKAVECFDCLINKDRVFAGAFFTGAPPAVQYVRLAELNKFPILGFFSGAPFLTRAVFSCAGA